MKNLLSSIALIVFIYSHSYAQVAGPSSGGTFAVYTIPGSSQTWANPGNVAASDDIYATFGTIAPANGYTDYLVVTNFGFSIPNGSTISGIVVEVERSDANSRTIDNSIRIVQNGVIVGDEKAVSATYPTTDAYQTYANAGDLWGASWSPADINSSGFGVAISARKINSINGTAAGKIDDIRITVYYDFVTLPVDLISFTAKRNNDKVALNWTTVNEINMVSYEVQRSTDGNNFSSITNIPSRNSITTTSYNYDDNSPYSGTSYYRLKMVGITGYTKYSKIVSMQFENAKNISLYPNPVAADQIIHIYNRNKQSLIIRFYDQAGRLVLNSSVNSDDLSLSALRSQKGLLAYNIINSKGELMGKGQLLVQ